MLHKQTIYLPANGSSTLSVIEEGRLYDNVEEQEGYFFTPEQLNEYTANVIKRTLETAAKKAETEERHGWMFVDKQSITDTLEETLKLFEI